MKRCVLSIALLASFLGAIQITAVGGGNYQAMNPDYAPEDIGDGWGWHGGVQSGITIVPSFLGICVGLEGGLLLQQANYSYVSSSIIHQTNLILPLQLKLCYNLSKALRFQLGGGPSVWGHLHTWREIDTGEDTNEKWAYETDFGLGLKGETNIKLADRLWLTPSVSRQFNLTAKDTWLENSKHWFFSLGLALKI
jgi:hypothetical protein